MPKNLISLYISSFIFYVTASLADITPELAKRVNSCEPGVAISAAEEIIKNPDSLKEPFQFFSPALVYFRNGKKDEAVFWYYAAQLRVRYQLASGEKMQNYLLLNLVMTSFALGNAINDYALLDASNFSRILDRVAAWDRDTPNQYPVRDIGKWMNVDKEIDKFYSDFRAKTEKLIQEKSSKESKAWLAAVEMKVLTLPIHPDFLDLKEKLSAEKNVLENKARLAAPLIEMDNPKLFSYCKKP